MPHQKLVYGGDALARAHPERITQTHVDALAALGLSPARWSGNPEGAKSDFTLLYTQAQMDAMIAATKERCAKIADSWDFGCEDACDYRAQGIAAEIRGRK